MLATELEAQHAPVSEQVPRSPLGHFQASPQVACTLQLRPRDRRTPEPHLRTITRSGSEGGSDSVRRGPIRASALSFVPPLHEVERGPGGEVPQHFATTRAFFPTAFLPFRRTVPPCSPASAPPPCSASTPISWTSRPTSRTASPPSPPWGCRREPSRRDASGGTPGR